MGLPEGSLLAAALGIIFSTISLLIFNKGRRKATLENFFWWLPSAPDRRNEKHTTPSMASAQDKEVIEGHKNAFPPSPRSNLPKAAASLPKAQQRTLRGYPVQYKIVRKNLMPFTADYRECGLSTYTPMGISIEEIRALGDFPDYAALSGVPLPKPYTDFEIDKAIARPYRPFRWAYHQNMCMSTMGFPGLQDADSD